MIALLVRTSSISQESLCIHQASVKQLLAGEEALLAEVAVEDGEEDQEHPDHQDHPQLLILVHLILHNTSVWLEGCGTLCSPESIRLHWKSPGIFYSSFSCKSNSTNTAV